jgi:hypothetical protein
MNIEKKENGFTLVELNTDYTIAEGTPEILNETQCHIPTQKGMCFFDTSVAIGGKSFETIEEWITELYN